MLNEKQLSLCRESRWDFSDLTALFLNCTLKRSPRGICTRGSWARSWSSAHSATGGVNLTMPRPLIGR